MDSAVLIDLFMVVNGIFIALLIYSKIRLCAEKIPLNWTFIAGLFFAVFMFFLSIVKADDDYESRGFWSNYFVYIYFICDFVFLLLVLFGVRKIYTDLTKHQFLLTAGFYWSLFPLFNFMLWFAYLYYSLAILGRC